MEINQTKKRIINESLRLFKESSFDAVTIQDICKASEINKTTFYYYFKSKDDLLQDFFHMPMYITPEDFSQILAEDNPVEQLWMSLETHLRFFENIGPEIFKRLITINLCKDEIRTFGISDEMERIHNSHLTLICKGQESGLIKNNSDPQILIKCLIALMHMTAFQWAKSDGQKDLRKLYRELFNSVLYV